ncbi:hypothetical protein FPV67DRAFT_1496794 [Lyophyllum atratum]|nr:hypothetical protein FPV67DRAFT_1496794 [Lyophyllum atratum]
MTWDPEISEQFNRVDSAATNESRYNAPYNSLLTHLFPIHEGYRVSPTPVLHGSANPTVVFVVRKEDHPVFILDVKPGSDTRDVGSRAAADHEMREKFERLVSELKIPKLYGLNAMGPRFAVYEFTANTGVLDPEPQAMARHSRLDIGDDIAPASRWDYNLLESEGEEKMREVVKKVKDMCQETGFGVSSVTGRLRGLLRNLGIGTRE